MGSKMCKNLCEKFSVCIWLKDILVTFFNCLLKGCLTILFTWIPNYFFCLLCHFIHIFFFHLFSKSLIDYYMLISMRIMLEKAPKTLIRLSDPGPIEKSPLCLVRFAAFCDNKMKYTRVCIILFWFFTSFHQ